MPENGINQKSPEPAAWKLVYLKKVPGLKISTYRAIAGLVEAREYKITWTRWAEGKLKKVNIDIPRQLVLQKYIKNLRIV